MAQTYFFYDLETSGLNPREDRIMQFAGIRTDLDFNQVGEPYNVLVKLNDDTLPSPEALMVTGISPQQTVTDGYTEAEFANLLYTEIFTPETITVGFNNIRFDDEFLRHLFWRNFHDPYAWHWKDGSSRWDILDVVRMTRALRPGGIEWPFDSSGKAVNKLELLATVNKIDHFRAHDALSDVEALIAVTKLIKQKQPQLYNYLLNMRDKKEVAKVVNLDQKQMFVYTSGRYDAGYEKTTVAFPLTSGSNSSIIVYDLRYDPANYFDKSLQELEAMLFATWEERQQDDFVPLPVKEFKHNQAPAVAPVGVLDKDDAWKRIGLNSDLVKKHQKILLSRPDFAEKIRTLFENRPEFAKNPNPEAQLYDGFVTDADRALVARVQQASANQLADMHPNFVDERLPELLLHYKARSFPSSLSESEVQQWEDWRVKRINLQAPKFVESLQKLSEKDLTPEQGFIIEELKLWLENVL